MSDSTPRPTAREKLAFVRLVSRDICHAGASLPYFGRRAQLPELTASADDARSPRRKKRRRA